MGAKVRGVEVNVEPGSVLITRSYVDGVDFLIIWMSWHSMGNEFTYVEKERNCL